MDIRRMVGELGINREDLPEFFAFLATRAYDRYRTSGRKNDIDIAVEFSKRSVLTMLHSDTSLPSMLSNLGIMLFHRYERTGEMADLEEAIKVARQAMESTSHDDP